jgi:hypothetical protein
MCLINQRFLPIWSGDVRSLRLAWNKIARLESAFDCDITRDHQAAERIPIWHEKILTASS